MNVLRRILEYILNFATELEFESRFPLFRGTRMFAFTRKLSDTDRQDEFE